MKDNVLQINKGSRTTKDFAETVEVVSDTNIATKGEKDQKQLTGT